jgi:chromosome partitioning protein
MDYDLPDGGRPPEGVPDDQPPIATSEPAGFETDVAAPEAPWNPPSPAPTADDPDPSEVGSEVEFERAVITELEAVEEIVRDGLPAATQRPLPRVIAIANQKGGVGKTTTAVNLGACLAELGHRTLVVDLDPQGNASTGLGINPRGLDSSMYDLDLAGAEIELVPAFSRELRLRNAIDSVKEDYDYVLIDCPPSLGLLTINAFAAASEVLVPIQCEYYALEGLGQLVRNVDLVKRNLNDKLEISTIVLVMYDARTKLADQVAGEVRDHFGEKVCRQIVPRTVRLSEAPSFGQPIITFDPSSRGSIAYRQLAKEVSGGAS